MFSPAENNIEILDYLHETQSAFSLPHRLTMFGLSTHESPDLSRRLRGVAHPLVSGAARSPGLALRQQRKERASCYLGQRPRRRLRRRRAHCGAAAMLDMESLRARRTTPTEGMNEARDDLSAAWRVSENLRAELSLTVPGINDHIPRPPPDDHAQEIQEFPL